MKSKEELWGHLCKRYPEFCDDAHVVKQTARGLRNVVFAAWEAGHKQGLENGRALADSENKEKMRRNPLAAMFGASQA